jgi:hypothetical protein
LDAWRGKKSPSAPVVIGTAVAIVETLRNCGDGRDRRSHQGRKCDVGRLGRAERVLLGRLCQTSVPSHPAFLSSRY